MHNYLTNRKRRTKINSSQSSCLEITFASIIQYFLIDLFFMIGDSDIASYAGDSTTYVSADNIDGVIKSSENVSKILLKWSNDNLMKSNADKCHLLVSIKNTIKIKVGNFGISDCKSEKLLGVEFVKLSFDDHI